MPRRGAKSYTRSHQQMKYLFANKITFHNPVHTGKLYSAASAKKKGRRGRKKK
jgi:hypothetical protein